MSDPLAKRESESVLSEVIADTSDDLDPAEALWVADQFPDLEKNEGWLETLYWRAGCFEAVECLYGRQKRWGKMGELKWGLGDEATAEACFRGDGPLSEAGFRGGSDLALLVRLLFVQERYGEVVELFDSGQRLPDGGVEKLFIGRAPTVSRRLANIFVGAAVLSAAMPREQILRKLRADFPFPAAEAKSLLNAWIADSTGNLEKAKEQARLTSLKPVARTLSRALIDGATPVASWTAEVVRNALEVREAAATEVSHFLLQGAEASLAAFLERLARMPSRVLARWLSGLAVPADVLSSSLPERRVRLTRASPFLYRELFDDVLLDVFVGNAPLSGRELVLSMITNPSI